MDFAGENFFPADLPDYDGVSSWLTTKLILAAVFWCLLLPLWGLSLIQAEREEQAKSPSKSNGHNNKSKEVSPEVSLFVFTMIGCLASIGYLIASSPHNSYASRGVFSFPLLSEAECELLLHKAAEAAQRNLASPPDNNETLAMLQRHPAGWQKARHGLYPTTDLNLVTDPFTAEDRDLLGGILDQRLAPVLERVFGVARGAIRANDLFVVRYDEGGRLRLANHTDDGDISFNAILNADFEGGGTRVWNRFAQEPFGHVRPPPGWTLAHSARVHHEGMPINSGTRYILVGFLSIDHKDPFTLEPTGLSMGASWYSLAWLTTRLNAGHRFYSLRAEPGLYTTAMRSVYRFLLEAVELLCDVTARHHVAPLVEVGDEAAYLEAMSATDAPALASWFRGQQIALNADGSIANEWSSRRQYESKFAEL